MKRVHVEEDEEEGVKRTQERGRRKELVKMQKYRGGLGQLEEVWRWVQREDGS